MNFIDVKTLNEKDIVKFINLDKTLVVGIIRKVSNNCLGITINVKYLPTVKMLV